MSNLSTPQPQLRNPYKLGSLRPALVHVQSDIQIDDYNRIYFCSPFRGTQDAVISSLLQKLSEAVQTEIPETLPQHERETRLTKLIHGATFPRISGTGRDQDERRGTGGSLQDSASPSVGPSSAPSGKNSGRKKDRGQTA